MSESTGDMYMEQAMLAQDLQLYIKASTQYKLAKCYEKAGNAFSILGDSYIQLQREYEAAKHYNEAGIMYQKTNNPQAQELFDKAIVLYINTNNIPSAANAIVHTAEIAEKEHRPIDAAKLYEKACDYYDAENCPSTGASHLAKAFLLLVTCHEYERAIAVSYRCNEYYLSSALTISRSHTTWYQICLLLLFLKDITGYQDVLHAANDNFRNSHQYATLVKILAAYESKDLTVFDQETQLNFTPWQLPLLTDIKARLTSD